MSSKQLDQCKTGDDFIRYAKKHGGQVITGGRHVKVKGPGGGICPIPTHPGDLPTGTRFSIMKLLAAIGLGIAILAVALPYL